MDKLMTVSKQVPEYREHNFIGNASKASLVSEFRIVVKEDPSSLQ